MSRQQQSRYCRRCRQYTLHVKSEPPTTGCGTHVVLILFTCGLWLPVGILLSGLETWSGLLQGYRCQTCGRQN